MQICFKHSEKEYEKSCPFCSKDYCEDCLLLLGKRRTVICVDCYNHFLNKIKKSTIRRYVYVVFGLIFLIPLTLNFFELFFIREFRWNSIFISWIRAASRNSCEYS